MEIFITTLLFASLATCSNAAVAPLSVQGNKLLINGKVGVLRGASLFWSNVGWGGEKYYNARVVDWLKTDWRANVIRAAMGVEDSGGCLTDPVSNKRRVMAVVDAAIQADMYVIIDWHSHRAHWHRSRAIAFFRAMAKMYGKHNNVIYEIFSAPRSGVSWSGKVKPYATAVIRAIRAIDPDNLIVVGTTTWSQDVDVAASDPIRGFENIAYTLQFFAGSHGQDLRDKARVALEKNVALFVTEWATVNYYGNGTFARDETDRWISFLEQNKISHCNWCVNDRADGASALKPGSSPKGNWSLSDLTDSGTYVRNLLRSTYSIHTVRADIL